MASLNALDSLTDAQMKGSDLIAVTVEVDLATAPFLARRWQDSIRYPIAGTYHKDTTDTEFKSEVLHDGP